MHFCKMLKFLAVYHIGISKAASPVRVNEQYLAGSGL